MARGARQLAIFREPDDYNIFLVMLYSIKKKCPFYLHGYCLMTNHFHLLISLEEVSISTIMKKLLWCYSCYFNQKYGYKGHLFDSRFTSHMIKNDLYFLTVSRYIHLNPVKAGIVKKPILYPYSSYACYMGKTYNRMLDTHKVLEYFAGNKDEYRAFVESYTENDELEIETIIHGKEAVKTADL